MEKLYQHLENGGDIRQVDLTEEEQKTLKAYSFLTEKPKLVVINVDEEQMKNNDYPTKQEVVDFCKNKEMALIEICGQLEVEIQELSEEDKQIFMEDLNIKETGIERLAKKYMNI